MKKFFSLCIAFICCCITFCTYAAPPPASTVRHVQATDLPVLTPVASAAFITADAPLAVPWQYQANLVGTPVSINDDIAAGAAPTATATMPGLPTTGTTAKEVIQKE